MKRVLTKIDGLDEKVGGGLNRGSTILTLSNSESCLRLFFQQMCYNLASSGHKVFYLTITKNSEYIRDEINVYKWDIKPLEENDKWAFVDLYTMKADTLFSSSSELKPRSQFDFFVHIRNEIFSKIRQGEIVAIDLMSDLLLKHEIKTIVEFLEILSVIVRKINGFVLLPVLKPMHDEKSIIVLSHLADVVIELAISETHSDGKLRLWKIMKDHAEPSPIPFSLTDRGIVIETFTRIV